MGDERKTDELRETVLNAASGYAGVVLGIVCFILFLAIVSAIVRVIVGAGTGV